MCRLPPCKSVANLSRGPDRGGRGRASPAVTPTARGPRGPVGGRDPDIFVRHAYGMTGGARARAGRHARVGVRVGVGQAGVRGRVCARSPARGLCAGVCARGPCGGVRGGRGRGGVGSTCDVTGRHARVYVRAGVCASEPSPDPRVLLARCLKTRGVTSKIVGRQRSRGRFRYISVGHSAHERKVGPCVAVLRGPSVDR